jgi:tRNA pseudouridine32 synthase/23S rRNA pseudouridine746 synthase
MYTIIPGLPVVFEDEALLVVDKPAGLLSQPGRMVSDSVLSRVLQARPDAHGPVLVHRLDMDTSGLLLLAKNRQVHRCLQQQFEHRRIGKRYLARLSGVPQALGGRIHLPLRLDVDDRPRQVVCRKYGKSCTTLWHHASGSDPQCIWLYPLTGRTHQLRVHMAHPSGLGIAIQGDRLYQVHHNEERLMLHARFLAFDHPDTGLRHSLQSSASVAEFGYKDA